MARRRRSSNRPRKADSSLLLVALVIGLLLAGLWWIQEQQRNRSASTPTTPVVGRPIRIATWNIREFSERSQPDLVAIADIIKSNQFDLIAIQEVQQQGQAVQKLRRQLNEPWRVTVSDPAGNGERFAFLYRSDVVELLDEPKLLGGSDAQVFARTPYMGLFRSGNFDFALLTVHIWYGDSGFNERRRQEIQALANVARAVVANSAEKDLIILGDFNEFRRGGNLQYFDEIGWKRLNAEPTNLSSIEVYDNLLIDPQRTREFTGTVGVIRFDEIRYNNDDKTARDDVSDHRPVYADFSTGLPDDD